MNEQMNKNMMTWVIVALIVGAVLGYFGARAKYKPQIDQLTKMVNEQKAKMEKMAKEAMMMSVGYVMKDGKMMVEEGGKMTAMTQDVTLKNGEKVITDGTVVKTDGSKMQLKEGQSIWQDGTMMENGKMMMEK